MKFIVTLNELGIIAGPFDSNDQAQKWINVNVAKLGKVSASINQLKNPEELLEEIAQFGHNAAKWGEAKGKWGGRGPKSD
jgi:hypothetical protein